MAQGKEYTTKEREQILRSLEEYFGLGYNRAKACMFAGFPRTTLQSWEENDESLRIRIDAKINSVSAQARENLAKRVKEGDEEISKWWVERREKKDWSTRTESSVEVVGVDDILEKLKSEEDVL